MTSAPQRSPHQQQRYGKRNKTTFLLFFVALGSLLLMLLLSDQASYVNEKDQEMFTPFYNSPVSSTLGPQRISSTVSTSKYQDLTNRNSLSADCSICYFASKPKFIGDTSIKIECPCLTNLDSELYREGNLKVVNTIENSDEVPSFPSTSIILKSISSSSPSIQIEDHEVIVAQDYIELIKKIVINTIYGPRLREERQKMKIAQEKNFEISLKENKEKKENKRRKTIELRLQFSSKSFTDGKCHHT